MKQQGKLAAKQVICNNKNTINWSVVNTKLIVYSLHKKASAMATPKFIKPTESELEILQIIWGKGLATVRDVHEELAKVKEVGYTTTLKLMQIMHEKGLVKRDESMRTHVYQAAVNKEKTQKHILGKIINSLFGGSSTQLVLQALGENKTSAEELEQIQILLNNLKKQ